MTPVRLEPAALRSRVKHSTTEPLRSQIIIQEIVISKSLGHQVDIILLHFDFTKAIHKVPHKTTLQTLGPLLLLCFTNDLPESIKSSQAKLFADDSLLFRAIKDDSDRALPHKDLSALEHLDKTSWQMIFNPIKYAVLRISTKKVLPTQKDLPVTL